MTSWTLEIGCGVPHKRSMGGFIVQGVHVGCSQHDINWKLAYFFLMKMIEETHWQCGRGWLKGRLWIPFLKTARCSRLSVNASFRQVDDLIKTQRRPRLGCEYIRAVGRQAVVTVMPMDGHYLGRGHSSQAIAPFIMLQKLSLSLSYSEDFIFLPSPIYTCPWLRPRAFN